MLLATDLLAAPSLCTPSFAERIAGLLAELDEARNDMRACASRFEHRAAPPELTVTYRGLLGPIEVDAEADWIREVLAGLPPHSRKARRLRKLLQASEAHWGRVWAEREASGFAAAHARYEAIEGDLRATAEAALDDEDAIAQTVALLAYFAGVGSRCEIMSRAPRLVRALVS
jgi:hypothetical protein